MAMIREFAQGRAGWFSLCVQRLFDRGETDKIRLLILQIRTCRKCDTMENEATSVEGHSLDQLISYHAYVCRPGDEAFLGQVSRM